MPHSNGVEEDHGSSAAPSQLKSCYFYQSLPMLVVAYQRIGHNPHRNTNS